MHNAKKKSSLREGKDDYQTAATVFYIWRQLLKEHALQTNYTLDATFPPLINLSEFTELVNYFDQLFLFMIGIEKEFPMPTTYLQPYTGVVLMFLDQWDEESAWMIRRLHSLCVFMTRTSGERPDLHDIAIQSFIEHDHFDHVQHGYRLKEILERIITESNYSRTELYQFIDFGHGPGSTAEAGRDRVVKDSVLGVPRSALGFYNKIGEKPVLGVTDDIPNRIITVPKSYKARRIIALEPVSLQYMQQGLMTAMYDYILNNKRKFFGRHCYLESTDSQKDAVMRGSINNELSTVDLSAASDRVSLQLVRDTFSNTFLDDVIGLRSKQADVDGSLVTLNKYATMGNALTFPVETLLFALICCEAIDRCGKDYLQSEFYVFGDDIIIDTEVVPTLLFLLEDYGFILNTEKSFYGKENFRESCGYFYYHGMDIAPLRISRSFSGLTAENENFERLRTLFARLEEYDFPRTAFKLREKIFFKSKFFYSDDFPRERAVRFGRLYAKWPIWLQRREWRNNKEGLYLQAKNQRKNPKPRVKESDGSYHSLNDDIAYSIWLYETRNRTESRQLDPLTLSKVEKIKLNRGLLYKEFLERPTTVDTRPTGRSGYALRLLPLRKDSSDIDAEEKN